MNDLITRFTSRKFLLAVFGVIIVFWGGLTPEQQDAITALIVAFTITEGTVDLVAKVRENKQQS